MMLQTNSKYAEQKITIQCKNTGVIPTFDGYKNGDTFNLEHDEDSLVQLKTLRNECSVCLERQRKNCFINV